MLAMASSTPHAIASASPARAEAAANFDGRLENWDAALDVPRGDRPCRMLDRPEAVYDHPADRFVAGFVGEASFLPCPTAGDGRGASCRHGCVLVARPHDLSIEPGGNDLVTGRRYLGSAWRYETRRADGAIMRVDSTAAPPFAVGDLCTVTVTADRPLHHLPAV